MISGIVQKGEGIAGATFGVPTANLLLSEAPDIGFGTYAGYASLGGTVHEAMIYYGPNNPNKLEVHLFDVNLVLYGSRLTVDPRAKISAYMPYTTDEAMRAKINDDVARARAWLGSQKYVA